VTEPLTTAAGTPIGGWVLRADPEVFDVLPMIEEYGQVFRYPIEVNDRTALMDSGQPCFLFLGDTSKVVGIWAVGEVVAPVFSVPVDPDDPDAGEQLFAEVELLPLVKPIALAKLRADPAIASSELVTAPDQPNPLVLEPAAVRAVEAHDFDFVAPTDDQLARMEEVLGPDDTGVLFQLVGSERSFGIRIDGEDDELLSVFTVSEDGAFELGRYEDFDDALGLIRLRVSEGFELEAPVVAGTDDVLPDGNPVAMLETDDGYLVVYRTGEEAFDLYDPDSGGEGADDEGWDGDSAAGGPELLGEYESLSDALDALAESVEELPDDE